MVEKLELTGKAKGAFKDYKVDTRGVFGTVTINCNGEDSCNGMEVYFQEHQDYQYKFSGGTKDTVDYAYGTPTINIKCASGACKDLRLFRLDDTDEAKVKSGKKEKTMIKINEVEVFPNLEVGPGKPSPGALPVV